MLRHIARFTLRCFGWRIENRLPQIERYVVIFGPHTSNWDFYLLILVKWALDLHLNFIAKHTLFWGPAAFFLRSMGGIPVIRDASHNVVSTMVEEYIRRDKLILAISPEGTRRSLPYWRTGFYQIALHANVPIATCYIHASKKVVGFGPVVYPTGNMNDDIEKFRQIYHDKVGIKPGNESKIVFREKDPKIQIQN